jgi:tetratricopeptide (TPR) repeat protein
MAHGDDAITALREALRHSPDNLPLRLHLADSLVSLARYEEAEREYKAALQAAPHDPSVKLGLANAYLQGGKASPAMVVVEELIKLPNPPAKAYLIQSKLLFKAGDVDRAVRQYKRAVEADDALADAEYAGRLGVRASADEAERSEVVDGRVRASREEEDGSGTDVPVERPKVTFKDVGGMDALKDEIRMKIIHPLTHAELYKAYGKAVGGGILMYGPPGCGKTHLARATAGEIKAGFVSIGINDVLDMWLGNSERNLHELFERARRSRPCVLFFDEVDALAASRSDMRQSSARHLINQFLAEMDGVGASNDGLLILAATNAPWHVDPAFRRPGRFDRILFVPPPDAGVAGRRAPAAPGRQAGAGRRPRPRREEDRRVQRGRPEGRRRPGDRGQAPRRDAGRGPAADDDEGPAGRRWQGPPEHEGVVRDGPELRALLEPGRGVRRHPEVPEAVGRGGRPARRPEPRVGTGRAASGDAADDVDVPTDMNPTDQHHDRAMILFQQRRYADAERELRAALADAPHDPRLHALLGLTLARQDRFADASAEADQAVGLGPDSSFAHYVRGLVLFMRHRPDEAAPAAAQAVALDPYDADAHWLSAAVAFNRRRYPSALESAELGLGVDPDHAGCTNVRAMALVKLGRTDEAGQAIDAALRKDPENADTHANQGWTLLHQGDHRRAQEHFREALRLEPDHDWARAGIVEAMKAKNVSTGSCSGTSSGCRTSAPARSGASFSAGTSAASCSARSAGRTRRRPRSSCRSSSRTPRSCWRRGWPTRCSTCCCGWTGSGGTP